MNTLARISAGIAIAAVPLAVAACGSSQHAATTPASAGNASVVAPAASDSAGTGVQAAVTQVTGQGQASSSSSGHAVTGSHKIVKVITPTQQKGMYSEGAHPKVPGTPAPTALTQSGTTASSGRSASSGTSHHSSGPSPRPASLKPSPKQPNLGKYVGPANNGNASCGYVAVGPGMEQAEAFTIRSVDCATARKVATASQGHNGSGKITYRALGFSCTGSTPSSQSTLRFVCSSGGQSISFIVS
jgi:hypothetical protein